MRFFCSLLVVAGLLSVIFNYEKVSAQMSRFHERLEVDMALNTLNLVHGRERRVRCRINRGITDLMHSTVEFIHEPRETGEDSENIQRIVLARNGVLVDGDPEFYGTEVVNGYHETTFILVYHNPRLQDEGYLMCRLTPGPDIAPPNVLSITPSRYVLVFGL